MTLENKQDFPSGSVMKNLPASAGDVGLIPGSGRSHMLQNNQACESRLLSLGSRVTTAESHMP